MRRYIVAIGIFVFGLLYLFFGTAVEFPLLKEFSVDKRKYSSGETVKGTFSQFQIRDCSCTDPSMEIYQKNGSEWKILPVSPELEGAVCVDGKLRPMMMCDLIQCSVSPGVERRTFSWDQNYYVSTGKTVQSCSLTPEDYDGPERIVNGTFRQAKELQASPGLYKMKVGQYEDSFRIE